MNTERDTYLSYLFKLLTNQPSKSISFCKNSHRRGLKIPDKCILKCSDSNWLISSQSKELQKYMVKKLAEKFLSDFCYYKCTERSCNTLCSHLYSCNGPDSSLLCKHVYKIHSYCNRNIDFKDTFV